MKLDLGKRRGRYKRQAFERKEETRAQWWSKTLTFVIFLALASVIWLLQSLQGDFTKTIYIPITYDSLSPGDRVEEQVPQYIEVGVQDKGFELIKYSLYGFEPILLSVSTVKGHRLLGLNKRKLTEEVDKRLSNSAQIVFVSPNELEVSIHQSKQRTVPIVFDTSELGATGYMAYPAEISPAQVTVYGDEAQLEKISSISVSQVKEKNLSQTITTKGKLIAPPGVKLSVSEVQLHIKVEEYTEQTYLMPINVNNQPEGYRLSPLPSSIKIVATFPSSKYGELSQSDFEIAVDFPENGIDKQSSSDKLLSVKLVRSPQWVKSVRLQPEMVQYIIEKE